MRLAELTWGELGVLARLTSLDLASPGLVIHVSHE